MSGADTPQGPGWWEASDGKWYPPDRAAGTQPSIPPSPGGSSGPAPVGNAGTSGQPGFFGRLFDTSMKNFITPSIVKVLFILGIIVISIGTLALVAAGAAGDGAGFLIVVAPLYWFIGVLYLRVILEVIVVLFRIEENTRNRR